MSAKRVEYYTNSSSDPVRSLSGPAGFTAGGAVGFSPAKNLALGADLSGLSRTVVVTDLTLLNWATIPLLQVVIPMGECGIVKGIWQYLTIGQATANADLSDYVEQLPITTPDWSFQDAHVVWHLSVARGRPKLEGMPNAHSLDGFANLGTFTDIRFPWGAAPNAVQLGPRVEGPSVIVMWAEVLQSDPATRPKLVPAPAGIQYAATRETNFVSSFTQAIYWRIAGGLVIEHERG